MSTIGSAVRETRFLVGHGLPEHVAAPAQPRPVGLDDRRLGVRHRGRGLGLHVGGATAVGVWGTIRLTLAAVSAPFTSALADRMSRRTLMVGCDVIRAVLVLAAAALIETDAPAITVFVIGTVTTLVSSAFRPAQLALTPSLVETPEELTAANGVASTVESLAFFLGPAIGRLPARRRRRGHGPRLRRHHVRLVGRPDRRRTATHRHGRGGERTPARPGAGRWGGRRAGRRGGGRRRAGDRRLPA